MLGGKDGIFRRLPVDPDPLRAMVGALVLLWSKIVTPREAYASIDWQVLLMLYGLLGLGMAMQITGTAKWLARGDGDDGRGLRVPRNGCRW